MPTLVHGEREAEDRILRALRLAVELSIVILVIEAYGALVSRSLSLTIDAVHNIPDILAFAISWLALRATGRGASGDLTFGPHRFEVFAGLLNGALVLGTGLVFGYAAGSDLARGGSFAGPVDALWLIATAVPVLGLRAVNLAVIQRSPRRARDLNLLSVLVHLGSDVAITLALLVAGFLILYRPGVAGTDSIAALAIAAILVYESLPLFRGAWDVLTERTPPEPIGGPDRALGPRRAPGARAARSPRLGRLPDARLHDGPRPRGGDERARRNERRRPATGPHGGRIRHPARCVRARVRTRRDRSGPVGLDDRDPRGRGGVGCDPDANLGRFSVIGPRRRSPATEAKAPFLSAEH